MLEVCMGWGFPPGYSYLNNWLFSAEFLSLFAKDPKTLLLLENLKALHYMLLS